MDVYQPSGFGRRRRRGVQGHTSTFEFITNSNSTAVEYSSPLAQHWRTIGGSESDESDNSKLGLELPRSHGSPFPLPPETVVRSFDDGNVHKEEIGSIDNYVLKSSSVAPPKNKNNLISSKKFSQAGSKEGTDDAPSTKFGDNIGFSVVMPAGKIGGNLQPTNL